MALHRSLRCTLPLLPRPLLSLAAPAAVPIARFHSSSLARSHGTNKVVVPASNSHPSAATAAAAAGRSRLPSASARKPLPSLKHFVLRTQVLALFRRVMRVSRRCPTPEQRAETVAHARSEIEAMRNAHETSHIKALLQEGKRKVDTLETMLNLTK